MIDLTEDNFAQEVLWSARPVAVDFYADWCSHCRTLAPIMEELDQEAQGRYVIGKVNTDKERRLAREHQISGLPTVVFFQNGREIDRLAGVRKKEMYLEVLTKKEGE